jgi:tetratricopeptide (TPR) repeat protein
VAVRTDDPQVQILARLRLVDLALIADDLDEAQLWAEQAQAVTHQLSAGESVGRYSLPALVYARQKDYAKAWENAEKAKQMALSVSPTIVYALKWYGGLAEVYLTLWENGAAIPSVTAADIRTSAKQACGALGKWARSFPIGRPAAQLWWGVFYQLEGKPEKAAAAWQKSLELAQTLVMPYDEALAHYRLGVGNPGNAEHLKQAIEIFERIGETHYLALARAKL